jgi:Electron transfer DM13
MSRRTVITALAAVAAVALAVGLPLFEPWRLFTNTAVDESLPGSASSPSGPVRTGSATASKPPSVSTPPSSTAPPTVSDEPAILARGTFVTHEHDTRGSVTVLRLADGSRVLRIEGLDTSDGPDLKVWLADARVIEGREGWHVFDDGKYVNLGDLKGNKGNQNYAVPPDLDLGAYRSVSIWCDRFNVSFGAAELERSTDTAG